MRINHQGQGVSSDRSSEASRPDRADLGAQQGGATRTSQVGLDRIDVSNVAETAARVMGSTGQQREQKISALTQQVQAGAYSVNTKALSSAILTYDSEPSAAYGG
ncbi:MAG: flagellar biosynthesis anti-sigma factor FlgM [Acidobacteriota bacterium]